MARKQRQLTAQFKLETVLEVLRGEKSALHICRGRDLTDSLVYMEAGISGQGSEACPKAIRQQAAPDDEQAERSAELARLVGQLTRENALLKKGASWLEVARRKNGLC